MEQPITRPISMINCFPNNFQEPYSFFSYSKYLCRYVMVKKSEHLPPFPEQFIYGNDKVVWIQHIRYIGYKFGELNQAYGIDIPHPKYIYLKFSHNRSKKTINWRVHRKKTVIELSNITQVTQVL